MHKVFGFDSFEVCFDLSASNQEFTVKKLKDKDVEKVWYQETNDKYDTQLSTRFEKDKETGKLQQVTTKMEALELEGQIRHETESLFEYELGFSRVIEVMIKARKPLVGHNMFLDILFVYQQFIADLPDSLEVLIHNFSHYFPQIYDTKAMAESLGFFTRTDLSSMSNKCLTDKKFKNYLEFEYDLGQGFNKYMQKTALHEAGYDSYLTGVVFASLAKQIEIQTFIEYQKIRGRTGGAGCTI